MLISSPDQIQSLISLEALPGLVNSNSWAINLDCVPRSVQSIRLRLPFKWLSSFLSYRSRVVQISNKSSKPIDLGYGVPLGSTLSPVLFLLYVNDVASSILHRKTNCRRCDSFFQCKYGPEILIADSTLDEVSSSKFLDRGLTWNEHIDRIFVMISLAKYCPSQVLIKAYYGLIYHLLAYGFQRAFSLHKKVIEIIAKIKFRKSCRQVFKKLQLLTLLRTWTRDYRPGRHRTVVYERLSSQAGVQFLNRLPNSIKDAPTPNAFKTRIKRFLVNQAFYNAAEAQMQMLTLSSTLKNIIVTENRRLPSRYDSKLCTPDHRIAPSQRYRLTLVLIKCLLKSEATKI
ncbi:hypothetical protein J6590_086439 [Homalodisca vitripennis]|nr:hypothetical protein J6590_086439 [Homalodisca vitripennis]